MSEQLLNTLLTRRSTVARDMCEPGPSDDELEQILAAGHRVPDHGKIGPWRFIVFKGEARETFGDVLADAFKKENPDCSEKLVAFERERFLRAPVVIAVVSSPVDHKVPEWEQVLCCGAVCQNMLNAATCLGFGSQWLTEWYAYDSTVLNALSVTGEEKVAGFIYIGSRKETPSERNRPELSERVQYWS